MPVTSDQLKRLIDAASAARERGYAPYSGFLVGAAVLDENDRVHAGCNVENAAYPLGTCAEAAAMAAMVASGGRRVRALLVAGEAPDPVTPCGGCRQRLRELAGGDTPVICVEAGRMRAQYTLAELLPASFGPEHLKP